LANKGRWERNRIMLNRGSSLAIRFISICFWIALFVGILYLPRCGNIFRSKRSLSIFTWSSLMDPSYLKKFEQETGIKLYISYYESNEELLSKMQATEGRGYDVVIPTDYMFIKLKKKGYLKKIDKGRLTFLDDLDPKLLGMYFDPDNEYSIPYFWAVYGLGIDKSYYKGKVPDPTWGLIFNPSMMPSSVGMTDNIREAVYIPAFYLFGSIEALKEPGNLEKVKNLLIEQKRHVEVYSEVRAEDLLLSKSSPIALGLSNDIWRAVREDSDIVFVIPKEGSFLSIDSVVIPKATEKDDLIYQFINFLYRKEVFEHHVEKYGLCPTLKTIKPESGSCCPRGEEFDRLHFFKDVVPKVKLNEVWLSVMAH